MRSFVDWTSQLAFKNSQSVKLRLSASVFKGERLFMAFDVRCDLDPRDDPGKILAWPNAL